MYLTHVFVRINLAAGMLVARNALQTMAAEPVAEADRRYSDSISLDIPHVSADKSVEVDYPIVYVRTPRKGDDVKANWAEIAHLVLMDHAAVNCEGFGFRFARHQQ